MSKKDNSYGRNLGEKIQSLRKEKPLTLVELGKIIGVSHVQVRNYEEGEQLPNAVVIVKIAEALGTTVEYLIKGEGGSISKSLLPKIERLPQADQEALLKVIDGFLKSREFLSLADRL